MRRTHIILLAALIFGASACKPSVSPKQCTFMPLATFETGDSSLIFNPGNLSMDLGKVKNPAPDAQNPSATCMRYVSGGGQGEIVWSKACKSKFDFSQNPPVFRVKVLAPAAGIRVNMKLEPADLSGPVRPVSVRNVTSTTSGRWEVLTYDFTDLAPQSGVFQKIVLTFNPERSAIDQIWYFDDVEGPEFRKQRI